MARGVHGQGIYVDLKAAMVIARYASHPVAGNAANHPVTLPAYMALTNELMAGGRGGLARLPPAHRQDAILPKTVEKAEAGPLRIGAGLDRRADDLHDVALAVGGPAR